MFSWDAVRTRWGEHPRAGHLSSRRSGGRQRPHRPVDPDDEVSKQTDGESLEHGEAEQHSVGSRAEVLVDKVVTELPTKISPSSEAIGSITRSRS